MGGPDPAHEADGGPEEVRERGGYPGTGHHPNRSRPARSWRSPVLTTLADGRLLLTGGIQLRGTGFAATPNAELFDPSTNGLTTTGRMNTGRWLHTATRMADGRVLLVGGRDSNCGLDCEWHSLPSAEIYDPATGTFVNTGSLNVSRFAHSAALLPDGRVIVFGGTSTEDLGNTDQVRTVEIYDPDTGIFSAAGMSDWRMRAIALKLESGAVLVIGGHNFGAAVVAVDLFH